MRGAWYNEIDPDAAAILRELIASNVIAPGDVDTRSIKEVQADDLRGYAQCHFFAGGGLWSVAARLAGWPDDEPLWTGSCPCQPFSVAGKGGGADDPRHLWPDFFRLIGAARPPVVMGEQVAGKAGRDWFHGVRSDLAGGAYGARAVDIPACAVDAPHIRQRLYWIAVADADSQSRQQVSRSPFGDEEANGRTRWVEREPYGNHRLPGDDEGSVGPVVHAASIGRREGRPEPELRSGRGAAAVTDAQGDLADRDEPPFRGHAREPRSPAGPREGSARAPYGDTSQHSDGARAQRDSHCGAVGDPGSVGRPQAFGESAYGYSPDREGATDSPERSYGAHGRNGSFWSGADWIICHDQKARRAKSGLPLLVDGLPGRVGLWRVAGNAISPILAAEVLKAFMETAGTDV